MSPRRVYFNGTYYEVDRCHPRARIFIWTFHGLPKLGQLWRPHWASR